jgi:hypothetical protein
MLLNYMSAVPFHNSVDTCSVSSCLPHPTRSRHVKIHEGESRQAEGKQSFWSWAVGLSNPS